MEPKKRKGVTLDESTFRGDTSQGNNLKKININIHEKKQSEEQFDDSDNLNQSEDDETPDNIKQKKPTDQTSTAWLKGIFEAKTAKQEEKENRYEETSNQQQKNSIETDSQPSLIENARIATRNKPNAGMTLEEQRIAQEIHEYGLRSMEYNKHIDSNLNALVDGTSFWWQLGGGKGNYAGDCAFAIMGTTLLVVDLGTTKMREKLKTIITNILNHKQCQLQINELILVITHWHDDHTGGGTAEPDAFVTWFRNRTKKHQRVSKPSNVTKITNGFVNLNNLKGTKNNGKDEWVRVRSAQWLIIKRQAWDMQIYQPQMKSAKDPNNNDQTKIGNDTCIGIVINAQDACILTIGDMEKDGQVELGKAIAARMGENIQIFNYFKIAHHSSGSNLPPPEIIRTLNNDAIWISSGHTFNSTGYNKFGPQLKEQKQLGQLMEKIEEERKENTDDSSMVNDDNYEESYAQEESVQKTQHMYALVIDSKTYQNNMREYVPAAMRNFVNKYNASVVISDALIKLTKNDKVKIKNENK
ncbi:hypothetical protein C0J08_20160 [Marinomonas sp. CT5]|uniref:hypothetical protein n=1 Tax=Marinomonas sp. CT5 TaxID=2066133 RepID=UPI001BB07BE5|nr:hypothetical protein [Marinomonas sp. CT5]QUX97574.1 hypothetical protein C0J08_20160 [Marinomonas sp. CT5]